MNNTTLPKTDGKDPWRGALYPSSHTIMGWFLIVLAIVAAFANGIMCNVLRKTRFRQPSNYFIMSMLFVNMLESVLALPMAAASNLSQRWLFGQAGCLFYASLVYTCILSTMCTFAAMGLYRYIIIVCPRKESTIKSSRTVLMVLAGVWLYTSFWVLTPFLGWGSYGYESVGTSCAINWKPKTVSETVYLVTMYICVLVLPASINIFIYIVTYNRTTRGKTQPNITQNDHPIPRVIRAPRGLPKSPMDDRLIKISIVNMVLFLLAWLPYGVVSLLNSAGVDVSDIFVAIFWMLAKTQCTYTPIVFIFGHKDFRDNILL